MNKIFEVGDLGPIMDIPEELIKLTNDNQLLKAKNSKQKTAIIILVAVIIGGVIYTQKNKTITKNEITE